MAVEEGAVEYDLASSPLTTKMYNVLKNTEGNIFFSPYSLQVVLAMTYAGAGGNTAKEFQKYLDYPEKREALEESVKHSIKGLKHAKNVTMNVANGMFIQKDYAVKPTFTKEVVGVFEAEVKSLNFSDSPGSAAEINAFVSKHTKGKIEKLFSDDAFTPLTKLVLANAVYFKGSWLNKFDPQVTFKGDFFLNKNDKVQVDYMTIKKKFRFARNSDLKASIIELPYEGDLAMVLVVPDEVEGIKYLEEKIVQADLKRLTYECFSREVNLTMPKFKMEQKLDVTDVLKKMGFSDIFNPRQADFSGITDGKEVYVSEVLQKTFIEVNEEGSEAAAATGITIAAFSLPLPPDELFINRPFIFYIYHRPSGTPLFFGRVSTFA